MTFFDLCKSFEIGYNKVIRSKKVKVKSRYVKVKQKLGDEMNISNIIATMISEMLEEGGTTEIQRNELAQRVGCVPSQINYVISSRFTPEHGYIVESQRGGGGYIRITKASFDASTLKMHLVNSIGSQIDDSSCKAHIKNLYERDLIDEKTAKLMLSSLCGNAYREIPKLYADTVRASIFKQILLNTL